MTFVQKTREFNVDEIDGGCQFHKDFKDAIFLRKCFEPVITVWHRNFWHKDIGAKAARKMLM